MASNTEILDDLLTQLRLKIRRPVQLHVVKKESDHIAIQVGENPEAIVGIRVKDSSRPLFHISYPKLTVKKDGSRHISLADFEGATFGGVEWVVGQLADHGTVMPEFVD